MCFFSVFFWVAHSSVVGDYCPWYRDVAQFIVLSQKMRPVRVNGLLQSDVLIPAQRIREPM